MISHFFLKIADVVIKINCPCNIYLYDDWENLFTKKLAPFIVSNQKHIILVSFSGIKTRGLKTITGTISSNVSMPIITRDNIVIDNLLHPSLFLQVLSKVLIQVLKNKNKAVIHSSGVIHNGHAILFLGSSGDGKSTAHNKLSPPLLSLGDDSIIVGLVKGIVVAYPTPLNTKVIGEYANNDSYPISKVCFLKKSNKLAIVKMEHSGAMVSIISQFKHPISEPKTARLSLRISNLLSDRTYIVSSSKKSSLISLIREF